MVDINRRLLDHPAAQRKPETNDEWLNFIKVLVQYTGNPDAIDVAIEGGSHLANALPNMGRATDDIESIAIDAAQAPLPNTARLESDIEALEAGQAINTQLGENRRQPYPEDIQYLNSSNNKEGMSPGPGTGYVPAADAKDPTTYQLAAFAFQQAYGRGTQYWNNPIAAMTLRTDVVGSDLWFGRHVAYRVVAAGGALSKGDVVAPIAGTMFPDADSGAISVGKALASNTQTINVLGIMMGDVNNFDFGYALAFGELKEIDVTSGTDPDGNTLVNGAQPIYLSDQTAGNWTINPPERRIKIGQLAYTNVTAPSQFLKNVITVLVDNEERYTFNGCSFICTGNATPTNDPDIPTGGVNSLPRTVNVASIVRQSTGVYRVTLSAPLFNGYVSGTGASTNQQDILDGIIEQWSAKTTTTGSGGNKEERRAYITAFDGSWTYFDFTFFEVVAPAVGAPVELVPMDMTTADTVSFFGQMTPF